MNLNILENYSLNEKRTINWVEFPKLCEGFQNDNMARANIPNTEDLNVEITQF